MYGQTSFDASKNSAAPKGVTALLLGLIVCYQVVNHVFMHNAVTHEDGDFESDAACTAVAGASGYSCMEAKLFQGWHELPADSQEDLDHLLVISPSTASSETPSSSPSAPATEALSGTQGLRGDAKAAEDKDSATFQDSAPLPQLDEVKPDALEGFLWDLAFKMGGGDTSHSAPEKNKKPTPKPNAFMAKKSTPKVKKPSFAQGLTDLQQKLEAKMQRQAKKHAQHRAIRALSVAARGHSHEAEPTPDKMTPWAHNLDDLTHELQAQMDTWQKHRSEHASAFADAKKQKAAKYDPMTPWAHNLDDLTHKLEHDMEARNKERAEHTAAHAAAHEARLAALHAKERTHTEPHNDFMDEIDALGRQLCQDPERRNRPACAQFLHPHTSAAPDSGAVEVKDSHENAMAHIKLLEKHLQELEKDREHDNEEIQKESVDFLKELCADPARHSYPSCASVLAKTSAPSGRLRASQAPATSAPVAVEQASAPKKDAYPHVLNWAPMNVKEDAQKPHHVDSAPLVMQRQDLRGAHWESKIPSVACVTVLPEGQVTETLMRYFMDNYQLQHYEGARELVLVYASADKEASRIAHLYADGITIKAASARGGDGYPSATAFRYGAWHAHDADLVVRWDFEAWHHPNRISMQVRAMTLSKRPASLVTMVTAFDPDGKKATVPGGAGPHGSMMGDAAWMRKHWMPFLEVETTVLHGLHSSDVVQVAMPDLLAYHDISMLGVAQPAPASAVA